MTAGKSPLRREFWRPDEPKVIVRKQRRWGWGWTLNFAEIARRLRLRPERAHPRAAGQARRGRWGM
jgi:hypothetical protein